jgi:hypothetical protein
MMHTSDKGPDLDGLSSVTATLVSREADKKIRVAESTAGGKNEPAL